MKNESKFIPTYKTEFVNSKNQKLVLSLDINPKNNLINEIFFSGDLRDQFENSISELEAKLKNYPIENLGEIQIEQDRFELPQYLFWVFLKEQFGILTRQFSKDTICLCFGLGHAELKSKIYQGQGEISLGEIMENTKATTGCGSCFEKTQDLYVQYSLDVKNFKLENPFPDFRKKTYSEVLIEIDAILKTFLTTKNIDLNNVTIIGVEGFKIQLSVLDNSLSDKEIKDLSKLVFRSTGLLVLFHQGL